MINTNNLVGKAGIYLRLSREDGDKFESDSIKNQRQLINDFLRDNPELRFFKEYADAPVIIGLKNQRLKKC